MTLTLLRQRHELFSSFRLVSIKRIVTQIYTHSATGNLRMECRQRASLGERQRERERQRKREGTEMRVSKVK